MTDPIADMLTRIRNSYQAQHENVDIPHSSIKASIAKLLKESNYVKDYKIAASKQPKLINITLSYINGQPAVNHLKRISKPGRRVYLKANKLPRPLSGYGIAIISTHQGLMIHKDAKKLNLGGEIICEVW